MEPVEEKIDMKQVYPVFIVNMNDESEHSFLACVPDMDIVTEGDSLADAIEMTRDAIGVTGISMEDHGEKIPVPSSAESAVEKVKKDLKNKFEWEILMKNKNRKTLIVCNECHRLITSKM